ncbi:unnamed protein product [Allacma fusca]|uniref:Uncharacterized protein n=1 Tax=Allacma fusca TaxID=39272 RepID=A0A8J2LZ02_9HEXA|nr:unnamed protein product [Allacma fusca]
MTLSDGSPAAVQILGIRPPHLSAALSYRQNLINFVVEVPPLPSPPQTELFSFPVPPPVPPRKRVPLSELAGLK